MIPYEKYHIDYTIYDAIRGMTDFILSIELNCL